MGGISACIDEEVPRGQVNYGLLTMRLSDGSVAYYEAGWSGSMYARNVKEFVGPKGRIRLVERADRPEHEEGDLIEYYDKATGQYHMINVNCIRRPTGAQLLHLIKMIEEDAPAVPSIDDVYKSLTVAFAADKELRKK